MDLPLNQNEKILLDLLLEIPPKYEDARRHICTAELSAAGITKTAVYYADSCFLDVGDWLFEHMKPPVDIAKAVLSQGIFPGLHSTYIYDVIEFLLGYGLDPNAVFETESGCRNIMQQIMYVDNEYLGADTLALLLEHGGDPNILIDGETVMDDVDADIWFGSVEQEIRWRYDQAVHRWMVLVGFGGTPGEENERLKLFEEYDESGCHRRKFDLARLRNHREFYFGLSLEERGRTLHIYDRKTFWKVAEWVL